MYTCFLVRDRAADSRFLIILLCRLSPPVPVFSGTLFLEHNEKSPVRDGGQSMASEKAVEIKAPLWPLNLELEWVLASELMHWSSDPEFKLRAVGVRGGGREGGGGAVSGSSSTPGGET